MKFTLKASSIAVMAIVSASAFAAAPDSVTQTAGTEIHWSGKVPMEFMRQRRHFDQSRRHSANRSVERW